MKRCRALLVALSLVHLAAPAAPAAEPVPTAYDPKQAFEEADANGDGVVDPPEFYDRMTEIFYLGDVNKDGTLDRAEHDAVVVIVTDFSVVDTNGDGKVSLIEFFRARQEVFEEVDTSRDGTLSEEEVVTGFRGPEKPAGAAK